MEDKNILRGPTSIVEDLMRNSIGELLLNQLHAHGTRIAQVKMFIYYKRKDF